jgi:hypothetical protein
MSGCGEVCNDRRKLVDVSRVDKEREELYAESVRRYRNWRRQQLRAAWAAYHCDQAARHRAILETLVTYHEGEAAKLQRDDAAVEGEGG